MLVKDGVLQDLDFSDFTTCVDCVKGKLTAKVKKSKTDRYADLLELIHTDICGPFVPPATGGYKYFITFIDDFSRYGHIFVKSLILWMFSRFLRRMLSFKSALRSHCATKLRNCHKKQYIITCFKNSWWHFVIHVARAS